MYCSCVFLFFPHMSSSSAAYNCWFRKPGMVDVSSCMVRSISFFLPEVYRYNWNSQMKGHPQISHPWMWEIHYSYPLLSHSSDPALTPTLNTTATWLSCCTCETLDSQPLSIIRFSGCASALFFITLSLSVEDIYSLYYWAAVLCLHILLHTSCLHRSLFQQFIYGLAYHSWFVTGGCSMILNHCVSSVFCVFLLSVTLFYIIKIRQKAFSWSVLVKFTDVKQFECNSATVDKLWM